MFNFATASADRATITSKLNDVQTDVLRILDQGGISAFNAEMKFRGEAAALIRESVIDSFRLTDLTPILFDRRTLRMGDTYEFEMLHHGMRVVEYSPASEPVTFTASRSKYTVGTSSYEMAFGFPLVKIMTRQHSISEYADAAAIALNRFYSTLAFTAVDKAASSGGVDLKGRNLRVQAAGTSVAKQEIDDMLRRMTQFSSGITIFGTRYALEPVFTAISQLSPNLQDTLNQRGALGTYRGVTLVEITDDKQIFDNSFTKINGRSLDNLLFFAAGAGQQGGVLLERDMSALSWETLDPRAGQWGTGVRMDLGVFIHSPWRYGVIQIGA